MCNQVKSLHDVTETNQMGLGIKAMGPTHCGPPISSLVLRIKLSMMMKSEWAQRE